MKTKVIKLKATKTKMIQMLNDKQKTIFNRIKSHYQSILEGNQIAALWIMIMGTAGIGKSYLIKVI